MLASPFVSAVVRMGLPGAGSGGGPGRTSKVGASEMGSSERSVSCDVSLDASRANGIAAGHSRTYNQKAACHSAAAMNPSWDAERPAWVRPVRGEMPVADPASQILVVLYCSDVKRQQCRAWRDGGET